MLTQELIERVLQTIPSKSMGLVGDLFLDRYLDIDAAFNEPSVETGLTAYQVVQVRNYPGALGTVLSNLSALGVGRLEPVTLIGTDGQGFDLLQTLTNLPGVALDGVIQTPLIQTPTYTKPMLSENGTAKELNRLDIKNRKPTPAELESRLIERIQSAWSRWDAVLILDQVSESNCGVITGSVRSCLDKLAASHPARFVLADSRTRISMFHHCSIKPNESEAANLELKTRSNPRAFVTRGADGLDLYEQGESKPMRVPGYPVPGPTDICGAGDSCSAGLACGIVSGLSPTQAAALGNLVASITVQQIGVTGTASPEQVRQRWRQIQASTNA